MNIWFSPILYLLTCQGMKKNRRWDGDTLLLWSKCLSSSYDCDMMMSFMEYEDIDRLPRSAFSHIILHLALPNSQLSSFLFHFISLLADPFLYPEQNGKGDWDASGFYFALSNEMMMESNIFIFLSQNIGRQIMRQLVWNRREMKLAPTKTEKMYFDVFHVSHVSLLCLYFHSLCCPNSTLCIVVVY